MSDTFESDGVEESEDLFDFDELYSPLAPVTGAGDDDSQEPAEQQAVGFDESDDLFNFDELSADLGADTSDDAVNIDDILADIDEEQPAAVAPASESEIAPAARTGPTATTPVAEPPEPVAAARPALRSTSTYLVLAFTTLNLALIGLTWRMSASVKDEIGEATRFIVQATHEIQAQTGKHVERIESVQQPVVASDPSQHTTFALARTDLDAGEYAAARRRLYALLAVADRLDVDVRESVEARAQFMLADIAMGLARAADDQPIATPAEVQP